MARLQIQAKHDVGEADLVGRDGSFSGPDGLASHFPEGAEAVDGAHAGDSAEVGQRGQGRRDEHENHPRGTDRGKLGEAFEAGDGPGDHDRADGKDDEDEADAGGIEFELVGDAK